MKAKLVIFVLLLTQGITFAASNNTGTTGGSFLKILGGCRPAALGNAFLAVSDDNNAIYWNSAGLSQITKPALSSMYGSWLAGIYFASVSYITPSDRLSYGLSFSYLNYGNIEETTLWNPGGTGRIFMPTNYALYSALAYKLTPAVSLGINGKYLTQTIDNCNTSGIGIDTSLFYSFNEVLSFGGTARNIFGTLGNDPLPTNFGFGVAYKRPSLTIAADYNLPNDNNSLINLGIEYKYNKLLSGRLGYNTRAEEFAGGNISLGLGLSFSSIGFDYAYVPYGELGATHRLSISFFPFGEYKSTISELRVTPSKLSISAGETIQLTAECFDNRLNSVSFYPTWDIVGKIGTFDPKTAIFTANFIGSGEIQAKFNNLTGYSLIKVVAGKPTKIIAIPPKINTFVNQPTQLTVQLFDAYSNLCDVKPTYTLTNNIGEINQFGYFIALKKGKGELHIKYGTLDLAIPVIVSQK